MQLPSRELTVRRRGSILRTTDAPVQALTAAATRATKRKGTMMRRLIQPWQARAMSYYEIVGECWNAAQFYSRSMKQVRIYAATRSESGELTEEGVPPEVQAEVARIQDPGGGGYSRLMDAYGRLKFLIGEGYFLITNPDGDDESWEFVSPDELRITGDGVYTRFAAPSLPAEELTDIPDTAYKPIGNEALVYRVWRPSPRYSLLADSPIRAVLDILEELVLLTLAVRGTAKNRLVRNGILYVPDEISPAPLAAVGDEDPAQDPFLERLQEQLMAGIVNPGSAAAVAPAIVRGAAEWAESLRWIQVSNPLETYPEEGLRTEAIRRFATGIEMPAETLTGTADVNHWGAWLIDEQALKQYVYPALQDFCDDLTSVFLRPVLKETGMENWNDFVIAYDATALSAKPDRTDTYLKAHDRLVISDAALLEAIDANEEDAPDQDEWDRRAALLLKDPAALVTPYSAGGPDHADDQAAGEEGGPETETDTVDEEAPPRPTEPPANELALRRGAVLGAVQSSLIRTRKQAGSKLRSQIRSMKADQFSTALMPHDQLASVPNERLAEALGLEWVRAHCGTELNLVKGDAHEELRVALASFGINGDVGDQLIAMVQKSTARTLCAPIKRTVPSAIVSYIERSIR